MTNDPTRAVIDADGHVLEPADTWLKYLDPKYRERAIRIVRDEQNLEVLLIDASLSKLCAASSARSAASTWTPPSS